MTTTHAPFHYYKCALKHIDRAETLLIQDARKRNLNPPILYPANAPPPARGEGIPPFFDVNEDQRALCAARTSCLGRLGCEYCVHDTPSEGSRAKKKRRTGIRFHGVPSLRVLAMRRVVVHYRRPSQFETRLPLPLANEVWRHLPARFLWYQRVARLYHYSSVSDCGCPRELWFHRPRAHQGSYCPYTTRVLRQTLTVCLRCCGNRSPPVRSTDETPPLMCLWCRGRFGECGCPRMPHATITIQYDDDGAMRRISLAVNRNRWPTLGSADLVGEGYLHGMVLWKNPPLAHMVAPLEFRTPPDVLFHCGIRVRTAKTTLHPNTPQSETRVIEVDQTTSHPTAASAAGKTVLVPFALETRLANMSSSNPAVLTGDHIFHSVVRHTTKSRTVSVFMVAARIYLTSCFYEYRTAARQARIPSGSVIESDFFTATYRATRGKNIPE